AAVVRAFAELHLSDGTSPSVSLVVGTTSERLPGEIFEAAVDQLRERAKSARNALVSETIRGESEATRVDVRRSAGRTDRFGGGWHGEPNASPPGEAAWT